MSKTRTWRKQRVNRRAPEGNQKIPVSLFLLTLPKKKACNCNSDNDNDNDNDTLREVPHPSNEGLALQARVSGPWLLKKESVLLVELARWQGAQVQTV